MTRILVQGIGPVGAFGAGVAALARALEGGDSPRTTISVRSGQGPVDMEAYRADTASLTDFVPARALRRMDHFTRMGLLGAHLALSDAGLDPSGMGLGLVIASGYGATATTQALLDSILQDGDACSSPTHFSNSLHNACAANIAIQLGCTGPSLTVSQFGLSVPSALLSARQWMLEGRVERVLFGAIDELSELIAYLWLRQRGRTGLGPVRPLDFGEDTAIPGEGAAFFLLTAQEDGPKEGKGAYAALERVELGRGLEALPGSPGLLVLGADGRREPGLRYAALTAESPAFCASHLYGSFPASPALDLAVGAWRLREDPSLGRVACLTLSGADEYGILGLSVP